MKKLSLTILAAMFSIVSSAQIGLNTSDPESTLDIRAKNHLGSVSSKDGVLVPRVNDLSVNGSVNGQLVYLVTNYGTFNKGFYYWDGTQWSVIINSATLNETLTSYNIPTVYARGRKTSTTTCTGLNTQNFSFNILSNPSRISSTGSINANKSGYYQFTVTIRQYFPAFTYSPIIRAGTDINGLGQYSYQFRGAAQGSRAWNKNSYSGILYLTAGQVTPDIQWSIGGTDTCGSADRIGEQEITWIFLGDDI